MPPPRAFLLTCLPAPIVALALSLGLAGSAVVLAQDQQPESGSGRQAKTAVTAESFMLSTANPYATRAGYEVLKAGGNAIDAAVAVQTMLNLVEPQSSGIGGGSFLLYWDAGSRQLVTFDGRETAPAAATPDYFLKPDGTPKGFWEAVVGGRSVGVPGTLRLLEEAHQEYGSQDWASLLQPAIERAEQGFVVSPRLAQSIAGAKDKGLTLFEATQAYFFNPDGSPKEAGTRLDNLEFAGALRLIARDGAKALYQGPIGDEIVAAVRATDFNPGILTPADLAGYKVKRRAAVCQPYRAYRVCGMGPPTSGGLTVGQMLGILGHFDLPGLGYGPRSVHLFAEAARLAYADRGLYMADADFVRMPSAGLLDPAYLTQRAQLLDPNQTMATVRPGNPPWKDAADWAADKQPERPGTSHFVIRDAAGNALSMTSSIETGFGSRIMVRGFLLNNELTDFSFVPEVEGLAVANRVEGGKRPRSSMAPTIVFKADEPYLLIGSPGGSRIINYVAKTIVAALDWNMDMQSAIDLGHFVNRNGPTDLEEGSEAAALEGPLAALGHSIKVRDLNSGLHGILIEGPRLSGGADSRREGLVMGD